MALKTNELCDYLNAFDFDKAIDAATALLDDMNETLMRYSELTHNENDVKAYCATTPMLMVYRLRAYAHLKFGCWNAAIPGATEGLALKRLGIGSNNSEPCNDERI